MTSPLYSSNSQNLIKQPPPSTMDAGSAVNKKQDTEIQAAPQNLSQAVSQRQYKRPNVGVITPARISNTPLYDTICIKERENPHLKYKIIPKIKTKDNFQKFVSLGAFLTGIYALGSLIFKKK